MSLLELRAGAIAAGGGCVSRAPDGRVVFVRHAIPGELVQAEITAETTSYLRADAVEITESSADRVPTRCPHAGPGKCGGCDWQHISLVAQRSLKAKLISEQMQRLANQHVELAVEAVDGDDSGFAWRTRVRFAVDKQGRPGFHVHRSNAIEPVDSCLIAVAEVGDLGVTARRWRGATELEAMASGPGSVPVISIKTDRRQLRGSTSPKYLSAEPLRQRIDIEAGIVVDGTTEQKPDHLTYTVGGRRFRVSTGVFWQVHPGAPETLVAAVMEHLGVRPGDRILDLYSGAGLFSAFLAEAAGPSGSVTAVERNARACGDAMGNTSSLTNVTVLKSEVTTKLLARHSKRTDLVVLDPAREGAGRAIMTALADFDPAPRRIVYVSCDPATFARDTRVISDTGWELVQLRAFDIFPMTEHVEILGVFEPGERRTR